MPPLCPAQEERPAGGAPLLLRSPAKTAPCGWHAPHGVCARRPREAPSLLPKGLHPGGGWHSLESCDECTWIGLKPTEYDVETGADGAFVDPWRRLNSP